jgi:hypothetical protein
MNLKPSAHWRKEVAARAYGVIPLSQISRRGYNVYKSYLLMVITSVTIMAFTGFVCKTVKNAGFVILETSQR